MDTDLHPLRKISIHALREEGDAGGSPSAVNLCQFLSTPSARRATAAARHPPGIMEFLSTPSARRATRHPDRGNPCSRISIHALREEGDPKGNGHGLLPERFLSTPSARRATSTPRWSPPNTRYFYPRPPRGGRRKPCAQGPAEYHFYPRPPRGGRPGLRPQGAAAA